MSLETQINPQALTELFNKEPEDLTDDDIKSIISKLREERNGFMLKEEKKSMAPKRGTPEAKAQRQADKERAKQLTLEELL